MATLVTAAGFSQVTTALAEWTVQVAGTTGPPGLGLLGNTPATAVLQLPVPRWLLAGRGRMPMAAAGAGLFAAAWPLVLLRRPAVLLRGGQGAALFLGLAVACALAGAAALAIEPVLGRA